MDYKLALELKEAGWPQEKGNRPISAAGYRGYSFLQEEAEMPVFPSLEQLIEACGEDFDWLTQKTVANKIGNWCAQKRRAVAGEQCEVGSTPEEAVARLWLALNRPTTKI